MVDDRVSFTNVGESWMHTPTLVAKHGDGILLRSSGPAQQVDSTFKTALQLYDAPSRVFTLAASWELKRS